jgi:hypothetical protein
MTRTLGRLAVAMPVLAVGCAAAGCGGGSALSGAAASRSVSFSPPAASAPALPSRTRSPRASGPQPEPPSAQAPAETPSPATEPSSPLPLASRTRSPRPPAVPPSTAPPAQTTPAVAPAPPPSPSTEPPSPSPEPFSPSPAASGTASSLLWLWILLGIAAVAGVAAWLARRSGKRSALAATWRSKVVDASAKGSALHDMMTMAEAPGALAAPDARARWADVQRRADDLSEDLYALRETAPGEAERARVADVLASLQAVRSAMEAERAPGGAGAPYGARVHDLLLGFEASLRELRSPGEYGRPL